ncbi:probable methyltransferase TCM_000168 [Beta vulgaris subsp. vulgaris]|uniref:probable methyltransferase TCM_000168 n=1 Tax=Beta vulgaris subsp. vulgaris TaxID=3555 RepID=UPI0020372853|nr:probable methyltransferase TCM_000168 [Beta vulgaris subsp. vulgaris]
MCNTMTSLPNLLTIADLGCSSGPNAFEAIWEIINVSSNLYQSKNVGLPEFKVFLNDLIGNDFNTLFRSLPEFHRKLKDANFGQCFVSATPESFHGRLFPNDFLHLVHASSSVHFLSQVSVPQLEILKNTRKIDLKTIRITKLIKRDEIVRGGQMVLNFRGSTQSDKPDYKQDYELLGLALHNLVLKGRIKEKELDGFNVPFYTPSIEEVQRLIEMQDSFTIKNIETFTIDWGLKDTDLILTLNERAKHASYSFRAITGPILASQFGALIIDELFDQFEAMVMQCLEVGKLDMMNFVISMAKK